jgi:Fe-S cluster assembly protein SufD
MMHWQAFLKNKLPTRREERWKYTDLSFLTDQSFSLAPRIGANSLQKVIGQHRLNSENILLVVVNGYFMPTLSDLAKLPAGVVVCDRKEALQKHAALCQTPMLETSLYPFAELNAAMSEDGLFLYVPEQCQVSLPIHLLNIATGEEEFIANPYYQIVLGKNSSLVMAEEHIALLDQAYFMNRVTTVQLQAGAKLEHNKIQQEGRQAMHMAHTFIYQQQNSHATFTNFSFGSAFARDELVVKLNGTGAECHTGGFYYVCADNQYIDHHVDIDHVAPRTNSDMLYKGILDKKSKAVFNGRLHVSKNAQKILAYQANHNLLLSKEAEVYSKPELEIYADDVKCKHGASTGQINQEAIFYLRSRGISQAEAVGMLLQGFSDDVFKRVSQPCIVERVREAL